MSFRDFLRYFGELEMCHLTPESAEGSDNRKKFEVFNFFGNWRAGSTAGGCGNDGYRKEMKKLILYVPRTKICYLHMQVALP